MTLIYRHPLTTGGNWSDLKNNSQMTMHSPHSKHMQVESFMTSPSHSTIQYYCIISLFNGPYPHLLSAISEWRTDTISGVERQVVGGQTLDQQ